MRARSIALSTAVALVLAARMVFAQSMPPPPTPHLAGRQAPLCAPLQMAKRPFAAGEKLRYQLDVYGADVGQLEAWLENPPREERDKVWLVAHARSKTSAFVATNVGPYASLAISKWDRALSPVSAREEVDDGTTRWLHELLFPPDNGKLRLRESKNGELQPLSLSASPSARDLLSTSYAIRTIPLSGAGSSCFEIFAGRHMWKMTASVGARETLDTPIGKVATVRVDLSTALIDNPRFVRSAHFWISDDERRLPVAAIAEVRGKTVRAQLQSASGPGWSLGNESPN